jgi:hypothetical protein
MIRKALTLGALALLSLAGTACPGGVHLTPCQNDNECPGPDGGHAVCYNLRCVECHYDGDCPDGKVCSGKSTCDSIDSREKEPEPEAPPTSLEECAKRCKGDSACGDSCRDRFK